jgi:pimeloyl-ACP methyl ester carboxylesterase
MHMNVARRPLTPIQARPIQVGLAVGAQLPLRIDHARGEKSAGRRARQPNLVHFNRLPEGGHFAAWEQPKVLSEELRTGFKSLRS